MSWLNDIKNEYDRRTKLNVGHRPDLASRYHISSSKSDEIPAVALNDYTDFADVTREHVWVRKGIKLYQDNFSRLPVQVIDLESGEPVENHELAEPLRYGNDQHGPVDNWNTWTTHHLLGGECFKEVVYDNGGRVREFWARRPDEVGVLPDLSRKSYPAVAGYRWKDIDYDADEMIHWKFDNPKSVWRGLSLIASARHGIVIDVYSQAWSKSFLRRGGNPDAVLTVQQGLTPSERESYERSLNEKYLGSDNWHKWMVLEKDITDVKPISWAPKDMQWLEQRNYARDEVAAIFGVPDILMGFGADTYDTDEKRRAAMSTLWNLTLVPLVRHRDAQLNTFFTKRKPLLEQGQVIATDLSDVQYLRVDPSDMSAAAKDYWTMGIPFNDINEVLGLGFPDIVGGNIGYLPLTLLPATASRSASEEEIRASLLVAQKRLEWWAATQRQPAPEFRAQERPIIIQVPALPSGNGKQGGKEPEPAPERKAPEYDSLEHRAWMKRRDAQVVGYERQMVRLLKKYFQRQQVEVGRRLREAAEEKQGPPNVPPVEDLFDPEEEAGLFKDEMGPTVTEALGEAGNAALSLVLGPDAWPLTMRARLVQENLTLILEEHSRKTNDTTFRGLEDLFRQAREDGASIPDMMDRLSGYFDGRKSRYETERIARTTMIAANNAGAVAGYTEGSVVGILEWLTSIDGREREAHHDAHGQQIKIGGKFLVGGELLRYPGDPYGSPENIVQCRCSVIPVLSS